MTVHLNDIPRAGDPTTRPGYDYIGYPVPTDSGPYCGLCSGTDFNGVDFKVRHIDAAAIKACFVIAAEQEREVENCQRVEQAYERHLEDRGYDDARAQEDYEARHGVVSFADAYRAACPELFA